jgi:hypothetical protein
LELSTVPSIPKQLEIDRPTKPVDCCMTRSQVRLALISRYERVIS